MELLIVLGLCFGAYELLGVFQGCFHNEHPLPYQPHHHLNNGDTKDENEDQLGEDKREHQCEDENDEKSDEQNFDSIKSGGTCSCISTTDDIFDDDTLTILKNKKKQIERKRFIFEKPISRFTVSTSLMSLNRDESNLFNYIDDINNNNKFHKFRSEKEDDDVAETTFSSSRLSNDNRKKKRRNSSDIEIYRKHNEHSESSPSVNVDINNKKIFFISAAT
jgi:hypothetical protein